MRLSNSSEETWELFKTDATGEWVPVGKFADIREVAGAIAEVEEINSTSLVMQMTVDLDDKQPLQLECRGRRGMYLVSQIL